MVKYQSLLSVQHNALRWFGLYTGTKVITHCEPWTIPVPRAALNAIADYIFSGCQTIFYECLNVVDHFAENADKLYESVKRIFKRQISSKKVRGF